ncbi:hypothetical protein MLD38_028386 [Melastoma candidum]|uniref:Uncharacterized protein n=1 Tax=Melastoma candidum TaxID=119954 RepID=A0ACB9N280_9MYRT|nr:hypothetical protein MLD38_028386 [Melastoma candidum]
MDKDAVKRYLENGSSSAGPGSASTRTPRFFESFIMNGLRVLSVEPGRVLCSLSVPDRLLNAGNFLHGGATAALVDMVGSATIFSVGAPTSGVSVEINVSYLDSAFAGEEIEIEGKVLRVGKAVGVVTVELRKKNGKIIAQARHTKYLAIPVPSKL